MRPERAGDTVAGVSPTTPGAPEPTSLDLSGSESPVPQPPIPPPAASDLADLADSEPAVSPGAPPPLGNLVVAHFRRVEVAMLSRILTNTLAGALPASMLRVERRRTLTDRLRGRPGQAIGVSISTPDRVLTFRAPDVGVSEASVSRTVRGVVLSTTPVTVPEFLQQLATVLNELTAQDEATRLALEQALVAPGHM